MCKLSGCPQPRCGDVNGRGINSQVCSIPNIFDVPDWNDFIEEITGTEINVLILVIHLRP